MDGLLACMSVCVGSAHGLWHMQLSPISGGELRASIFPSWSPPGKCGCAGWLGSIHACARSEAHSSSLISAALLVGRWEEPGGYLQPSICSYHLTYHASHTTNLLHTPVPASLSHLSTCRYPAWTRRNGCGGLPGCSAGWGMCRGCLGCGNGDGIIPVLRARVACFIPYHTVGFIISYLVSVLLPCLRAL